MKLSARERTGLRAMVEFARHYGQGPTSLSEVARIEGLPLPYLGRVVGSLRRSGLLESVRGVHGGYLLARQPSTISVGDVFRAVGGPVMELDCLDADGAGCAREATCAARNVLQLIARRMRETLDDTSLADIIH